MFVPDDLSVAEETLVATLHRQMAAARSPQTEADMLAVSQEADQVAAEMIQAARAEHPTTETTETPDEPETESERFWREWSQETADLDAPATDLGEFHRMETAGHDPVN